MGDIATHIEGEVDGLQVRRYILKNPHGHQVHLSELGACLLNVEWMTENENLTPLLLSYASFEQRLKDTFYIGSTVGRFGNRIAHGKFTLDGKEYSLATNNDPGGIPCHLHGGVDGFNRRVWSGEAFETAHSQGVTFTLTSPDGDENYPGNLTVAVTYEFNDDNELIWSATATTDQATPVNIINHAYWNLSGGADKDVHDHILQIHADQFLPRDEGMIPTGEIATVTDTPMDFTSPRRIGDDVDSDYEPIALAQGYDHCWVLHQESHTSTPQLAATLRHPRTGRSVEILTDQPGIQCYTGNFLDKPFARRAGIAMETQSFPDAPNHPNFPNSILRPGETYSHKIIWRLA